MNLLYLFAATVSVANSLNLVQKPAQTKCYGKRPAKTEVDLIIIHHTAGYIAGDLATLTKCPTAPVSSHYLVPSTANEESEKWEVYKLVPEANAAYHAGESSWQGTTSINSKSIGIEISHAKEDDPYPDGQIDTVIDLIKDILKRRTIDPTRIIGHADIAYDRKASDPGRKFPWKKLNANGIGMWPIESDVNLKEGRKANVYCAQTKLGVIGYEIGTDGIIGKYTKAVLLVFQKHFGLRETQQVDGPTASTIEALIKRYFSDKLKICKMFN